MNHGIGSRSAGSPRVRAVLVLALLTLHATSCGGGGRKTRLVRIEVTPSPSSLAQGTSVQYTAIGIYARGKKTTRKDITDQVTWISGDGSVAAVSNGAAGLPPDAASQVPPKGTVSGLIPGSTTIAAQLGKVSGQTPVTVTNASLVSIAVDPPAPSIANGTTQQFTATGLFTDFTTQDLTTTAAWSSSDVGIATISNALGSQGRASGIAVGSTTITASFGGISGVTALTVTAATMVSIDVTPPDPSISNGTTQQFTATGVFTDLTTQNMTTSVTWSSSAEGVATISNALGTQGLATSSAVGVTTITATFGGLSGSTTLTVKAATLVTVDVTPAEPSIANGAKQQFTASGTYTDNSTQDITSLVTWSSSSEGVATISNAPGSEGHATGTAVGVTTIRATSDSIAGQTRLTVTAATLVSLAVTPANPSIANGTQQQFGATGTYTDNSTQDLTTEVTWSSSEEDVATISNAESGKGLATGSAVGKTTIRATFGSIAGTTQLTVKTATLDTIEVTPPDPSIPNGRDQQFKATGIYTDNSKQDLTESVTWSSSEEGVATISNANGSEGLASAKKVGSTLITASSGEISGVSVLTVTAGILISIQVTPVVETITVGTSRQFTATGTYSDGSTQNLTTAVTWTAFTDGAATISNAVGSKGRATGTGVGSTAIVAKLGEIAGEATLTVTAATLQSIAVTPAKPSIANGTQQQFGATGTYSDDSTQDLTTEVTWSSSDDEIATISNSESRKGLATATAVGKTTIRARLGSISGSTELTVTRATLDRIEVTPPDPSIPNGTEKQFTATGIFTDKSKQDLTTAATWSSEDEDVATISNAEGSEGLAHAKKVGSTRITASFGELSGVSLLTVKAGTLESIEVRPPDPSITLGQKQQFTALGRYTDDSTQDLTAAVTWSAFTDEVATISNAAGSKGLATGTGLGTTAIVGTLGEIAGEATLTVNAATLESIAVTPADVSITNGTQQQFAATGTYSDSSTQDLTAEATWSSSDDEVATISNSESGKGLATAGSEGKSTIRATLGSVSGSTELTVTEATLDTIEVTPSDPSIPNGAEQQFKATGIYTDNSKQDITKSVTWSSEDEDIAAISNAKGSEGLASSKNVGTTRITASAGEIEGVSLLTVTVSELLRLRVSPINPSVHVGLTQQFTATGVYSDGSSKDLTSSVTWSSSDEEYVKITKTGLATAIAEGETITITATLEDLSAGTQVTVTGVILLEIRLTPADSTHSTNFSFQMTATAIYSSGFEADQTQDAEWSSSEPSLISVDNATEKGRVTTGDQPNHTVTITAKIGDVSGNTTVSTSLVE